MCKVVQEYDLTGKGGFALVLDEPIPLKRFYRFDIGGEIYEPVPLHGFKRNVIGVHGKGGFVGKPVEFV